MVIGQQLLTTWPPPTPPVCPGEEKGFLGATSAELANLGCIGTVTAQTLVSGARRGLLVGLVPPACCAVILKLELYHAYREGL